MGTRNRIVICGGGAIGASLAYFLARRGTDVVVVERHEVGGAASGKSGGFLALDWNRGTALDRLARRSFELHAELAETLGNPWGYRRLTTYGGYVTEKDGETGPLPWLSGRVELTGQIGTTRTTALVEPHAYTTGMMRAAETFGAKLLRGTVIDLLRHANGAARGVALENGEIDRGRLGGDRHGPVVGVGVTLAADARGLWPQGPQPRLQGHARRSPKRFSSNTRSRAARY